MQCKAKARSTGSRCKRKAVEGLTVCRSHGAGSPQAKAKAARLKAESKAEQAMRLFHAPVDLDPAQALIDLVQWTAGEVAYWRTQVRELADEDPDALTWGRTREKTGGHDFGTTLEARPNVTYLMLTDAQDRLARYAAAALKAGVQERQIKLAEDLGGQLVGLLRRVLDRLDLADWQEELAATAVPEELRRIAS